MSNTYEKVTFSVLLLTLNELIAELDVIERCKEKCDQVNVSIHRLPFNFWPKLFDPQLAVPAWCEYFYFGDPGALSVSLIICQYK